MGLVVRKCHFDVTACAEARRLDNMQESLPSRHVERFCGRLRLEEEDIFTRSIFRGLESFSQLVYLKKGSNSQVIQCNHFPVEAE